MDKNINSKKLLFIFSTYYRILYAINQDFIKLCGLDAYRKALRDSDEDRIVLMEMITNITRVIPYERNKRTGLIELNKKDAFMDFRNSTILCGLKESYMGILNDNIEILGNIKIIRNKYEHVPHIIGQLCATSSGSIKNELFSFTYIINGNTYVVEYIKLRKLIMQLNVMFEDIRNKIMLANKKDGISINFKIASMFEFSLLQFNRIYESEIAKDVGRIMWPL